MLTCIYLSHTGQNKVGMLQESVIKLDDKLKLTPSRITLKQALGNTIMRWWSYYRTSVAVWKVRPCLVSRSHWTGFDWHDWTGLES